MNKELCDNLDKFAEHLKDRIDKEELKTLPTCLTEQRLFEIVEKAVRKVLSEKENKTFTDDNIARYKHGTHFNPFLPSSYDNKNK